MKTRLFTLLCIACLACCLCACNSADNSSSDVEPASGITPVSDVDADNSNDIDQSDSAAEPTMFEALFVNSLAPAQDITELWGYIDSSGDWAIAPTFVNARRFWGSELAFVQDAESNLWGLIDKSGQYILEPSFSGIGNYVRDGLFRVCVPDRGWGYIDTSGSFVIEPQFDAAKDFSEGFAAVSSHIRFTGADNQYYYQLWGYIDTSGERLTGDFFTEAYDFSDGMACIKKGDVFSAFFGYIDTTGNEVIPTYYDRATSFYEERAFVQANGSWEMIDLTGSSLAEGWFDISTSDGSAFYWNDDIAPVELQDGSGYVYINKNGERVLPETGEAYAAARPFSSGYAAAASPGVDLYGYIDLTGNWIISPQYSAAYSFSSSGLASVRIPNDNKCYIIDTTGASLFGASDIGGLRTPERVAVTIEEDGGVEKTGFWSVSNGLVIDYIFDQANDFAADYSYARVKYNGLWGIIDKDGNWMIPAQFLDIGRT